MIKKIKIENFKCFEGSHSFELNSDINILVGDNEAGKSTILEAIHLVLTGYFKGKTIKGNLTQYLFNYNVVKNYLQGIEENSKEAPPYILIELYFDNEPLFEGDNFSEADKISKASGISMKIAFDEKYYEEYESFLKSGNISSLPIEYYDIEWYSFARKALTSKSIPIKSSLIDVGFSKFYNGSDMYISRIVQNLLEVEEKTKIAQAYRKIKEDFSEDDSIKQINAKISDISNLSNKSIELSVDLSTKSTWEGSLITQLDKIPFDYIGKGEQAIIKTELALSNKRSTNSSVILIEEPESHISHTRLNQLLNKISETYENKQIILTTHSSMVANKLGLNNLILINDLNSLRFNDLESKSFFQKISGYDTLRLILCKRAILVEGDSDELIVQRAYKDNYQKLPIEDGIEVISVGTSFLNFLEIAEKLNKPVYVITDNDGDISRLKNKYKKYINGEFDNIKIFYEDEIYEGDLTIGKKEIPFNYNTLEPLLLRSNDLKTLNKIFNKDFNDKDKLLKYMYNNKTTCALNIFLNEDSINYPGYIMEAIK